MIYETIIIGGGASGLMLAARLKVNRGLVLEGSPRCGTKLLMSGGGHCNITHGGSIKDFTDCYGSNGGRIRSCLYKHSNLELMDFLETNGVAVIANEEERVFPASMKSQDILNLLTRKASENGWQILTDSRVSEMKPVSLPDGSAQWNIKAGGNCYTASKVVIASGGITYANTGSDGSMFNVLRSLGVSIIEPKSVLAPLTLRDYPYADLAGITLHNVEIKTGEGKKAVVSSGDMLFAHREITGPSVLNISRYTEAGSEISISYIPSVPDPLAELVAATEASKAELPSIVADVFGLPKRFAAKIVERASDKRKTAASRDGISLKRIVELLTCDAFIISSRGSNGMVTAGGVSLSEISTKTFEVKKHPGLYVIGEALDVDGITGGYNLQFAYSSAAAVADALRD